MVKKRVLGEVDDQQACPNCDYSGAGTDEEKVIDERMLLIGIIANVCIYQCEKCKGIDFDPPYGNEGLAHLNEGGLPHLEDATIYPKLPYLYAGVKTPPQD